MRHAPKALLIALTLVSLSQVPAKADQLVVFKNGKAMRVVSATKDGKWLKCAFDDKTFLSIPTSQVSSVEEAASAAGGPALKVNQVAVGSGGGGGFNPGPQGIGAGGLPPDVPAAQDDSAQEQADVAAALAEEEAARRAGTVSQQPNAAFGAQAPGAVGGRRGSRFNAQPNGLPQNGMQPMNQASPFQNRSLSQRGGQSPRMGVPGGGVRATSPTAIPNQNQNQNQNQDN